ncbi:MAG: hypothetical protein AUG00_03655 [Candidatus Rokubacteria bacterium 13_1_20CM_2_70_7]|nr:MAG: hypothetical protein AUG00_03655 [Candidatus Rokubacteria bacterium 13_1_20CM_2_70_7]
MTAAAGPRVPLATYRLQLGSDLTFDDAARVLDYLAALACSRAAASRSRRSGTSTGARRLACAFPPKRAPDS